MLSKRSHSKLTFPPFLHQTLSHRPQSVEEISVASANHKEFSQRGPETRRLLSEAESKNKLLRTVAGGGIDTIYQLSSKWDKFELMLESFQLMVREQIDVMKSNVESRVRSFQQELEKAAARWHQLKPSKELLDDAENRDACLKAIATIRQKKEEFEEMEKTKESLM